MDTQKLLNAPPKQPRIVAKVSKINNLVESSKQIERSSAKLRKIFETGAYQKKTQLSVLSRYKKRLDGINKESDKRLEKRRNQKGKSIVPKIKPFAGSLFVPKNDPLKSIAQLAAFNAASKLAKGDVFGMVGPGLALASIIFGPKLLKFGAKSALKSVGVGKGYENLIKKLSKSKNLTQGEESALKNFDRYRKAGLSVEEAAQRALVRGGGYSVKTAKEYRNLTRTVEGVGERAVERTAGRAAATGTGKAAGGLLKNVRGGVGLLDVAFAGFDFMSRKSEGQTNLQAGAGAAGGAIGGIAGWEAGAAIGAAIGAAFGGIGAVPGAIIGGLIGSFAGSSLGGGLADMLTGVNKSKSLTGKVGNKPFSESLDKYENVVNKFFVFAYRYNGNGGGGGGADPSNDNFPISPSPTGLVNPVPSQNIAKNRGGYAADTGLDILTPVGSNVVSPVSGTLEYAEKGHVRQMGQDANPFMSGKQDQHSVRIKLDKPFMYAGKEVKYFYATHLYELANNLKNKSNVKINAGDFIGKSGVANNVPHVHVGFVEDREQTKYLNYTEVKSLLTGVPSFSSASSTPRQTPNINQYTRYSPSAYGEGEIIPLPISLEQQQQMMQGEGSSSMMIMGPSEQDLLNSFYKRVLLNTVA